MTTETQEELTPELALDLWYQALSQEIGIVIPTNLKDCDKVRFNIYLARNDINDPRLQALSMHVAKDGENIYIYKKEASLD